MEKSFQVVFSSEIDIFVFLILMDTSTCNTFLQMFFSMVIYQSDPRIFLTKSNYDSKWSYGISHDAIKTMLISEIYTTTYHNINLSHDTNDMDNIQSGKSDQASKVWLHINMKQVLT